jgi:hypothetical protein
VIHQSLLLRVDIIRNAIAAWISPLIDAFSGLNLVN